MISSPIGGPADIVREGENGYLTPIGDALAMAQRLEQFFSLTEDRWRAMSNAAYRTAAVYSWDDAADLFETALRNE